MFYPWMKLAAKSKELVGTYCKEIFMSEKKNVISRRNLLAASAVGTAGILSACNAPSFGKQSDASATKVKPSPLGKPNPKKRPTISKQYQGSDVIVIGAGLSGLNASLLLEEMGYTVTVLEGRDRVGGRLYTMDDVPGHPEAGGSGIGASYGRLLGAMEKYNVGFGKERPRTVPQRDISMLNIRGQHIQFDEWKTHPLNPMPNAYKKTLPWLIQYGLYSKDNPLSNPEDFVDPAFAKFDISAYQYFKDKGFSARAIELAAGTNMSYGDTNGPHGLSTLLMYNVMTFGRNSSKIKREGSPFAGVGGNQRIPEGMASGLKTDIQFNTKVIGIRHEKDHGEVHLENGQVLKAKRVIVTIPFSALRLVDIDAPMPMEQHRAIRTLGYTNVTHVSFIPKRKFWEDDGMPPSMWTDGAAARFNALRNNPDNPEEITSFMAFANDRVADHLDRLGAEAGTQYVLDYLARIRPSTKDALEPVKFWSWQLDPFAGGAYAAWKPGQLSSFGKDMSAPAGRIHFAGEHTALAARGMEGAMESGERTAFEVADLL